MVDGRNDNRADQNRVANMPTANDQGAALTGGRTANPRVAQVQRRRRFRRRAGRGGGMERGQA